MTNSNYTKVPNGIFKINVSCMAKLLWIHIQSKPSNYVISQKNLADDFNVSVLTIRKAIRELKMANLLEIKEIKSDKRYWEYTLFFPDYTTSKKKNTINHVNVNSKFFMCPNTIITNNKISKRARLVLFLIMSKPQDYNINQRGLATEMNVNKMTINCSIKELKFAGYLKIKKSYNTNNCTSSSKYFLCKINNFRPTKQFIKKNIVSNKPSKKQLNLIKELGIKLSKNELKNHNMSSLSLIIKEKLELRKNIPTKKQVNYALKLGINSTLVSSSTKKQLGEIIGNAKSNFNSQYIEPIWDKVDLTADMITADQLETILGLNKL